MRFVCAHEVEQTGRPKLCLSVVNEQNGINTPGGNSDHAAIHNRVDSVTPRPSMMEDTDRLHLVLRAVKRRYYSGNHGDKARRACGWSDRMRRRFSGVFSALTAGSFVAVDGARKATR